MTTLNFQKIISQDGKITFLVNDEEFSYNLSRLLTGTTTESGYGVFSFSGDPDFSFGEFKLTFNFTSLSKFDSIETIASEFKNRIIAIREWVAVCRGSGGTCTVSV